MTPIDVQHFMEGMGIGQGSGKAWTIQICSQRGLGILFSKHQRSQPKPPVSQFTTRLHLEVRGLVLSREIRSRRVQFVVVLMVRLWLLKGIWRVR